MNQSIFRAYDIRGIYPSDIDEDAVYRIARGYIRFLQQKPKFQISNFKFQKSGFKIALGKDVRTSSPALWRAAARGLIDEGAVVTDIGTISTDMLYFAVGKYGYDGGIIISASHNPAEYNGLKIVREKAIPISSDSGLFDIRDLAEKIQPPKLEIRNLKLEITQQDIMREYVEHNLSFIDKKNIRPFKVVINANFGMAGVAAREIVKIGKLPVELIELNCEPDGTFPKGRPDPLIPENRHEVESLIKESGADLGVAWDADADRCFFFDDNGKFVTPAFMTSLMAMHLLAKSDKKGEKIINDTRIYWPIEDAVKKYGGELILTKAGHTFIKEKMRQEDALFGAETSAHYYYRDNFYADNGMISFLLVLEILSRKEQKLSEIIKVYREKYAVSDEMNFEVKDAAGVLASFKKKYAKGKVDDQDGLSISFPDWRFSLRTSNTEPLVRLNVETRGDYTLLKRRVSELSREINNNQ
jgi:phosphomannomutase